MTQNIHLARVCRTNGAEDRNRDNIERFKQIDKKIVKHILHMQNLIFSALAGERLKIVKHILHMLDNK
jgi:uncharacterized damage-inducible protein DinB